jgi:hypothetical protein
MHAITCLYVDIRIRKAFIACFKLDIFKVSRTKKTEKSPNYPILAPPPREFVDLNSAKDNSIATKIIHDPFSSVL